MLGILRNMSGALAGQQLRAYLVSVVGTTLIILLYLGVVASEGYVSRAQVMVEEDSDLPASALALGLLSVGSSASKVDALVVETYMRSPAMLQALDEKQDLMGHFSSDSVDMIGRLDHDASRESFLKYYNDHLTTEVDEESFILTVEFVAYSPEFAQAVVAELIERSERFVNDLSHELARQQLSFVERETTKAHQRLKDATAALIDLQRQYDVISPESEVQATGSIVAGLQRELSKQRTELKTLSGYLSARAPEVISAKQKISALEEQIVQERQRLVGSHRDQPGLNDIAAAYQDAQGNVELAAEIYKTAMATQETTRLDAVRKVKYLVSVAPAVLPDEAEHPRIAYWTFTAFIFLNLLYFVATLIVATIQDHRE